MLIGAGLKCCCCTIQQIDGCAGLEWGRGQDSNSRGRGMWDKAQEKEVCLMSARGGGREGRSDKVM